MDSVTQRSMRSGARERERQRERETNTNTQTEIETERDRDRDNHTDRDRLTEGPYLLSQQLSALSQLWRKDCRLGPIVIYAFAFCSIEDEEEALFLCFVLIKLGQHSLETNFLLLFSLSFFLVIEWLVFSNPVSVTQVSVFFSVFVVSCKSSVRRVRVRVRVRVTVQLQQHPMYCSGSHKTRPILKIWFPE